MSDDYVAVIDHVELIFLSLVMNDRAAYVVEMVLPLSVLIDQLLEWLRLDVIHGLIDYAHQHSDFLLRSYEDHYTTRIIIMSVGLDIALQGLFPSLHEEQKRYRSASGDGMAEVNCCRLSGNVEDESIGWLGDDNDDDDDHATGATTGVVDNDDAGEAMFRPLGGDTTRVGLIRRAELAVAWRKRGLLLWPLISVILGGVVGERPPRIWLSWDIDGERNEDVTLLDDDDSL
jgi:hypothetical protein